MKFQQITISNLVINNNRQGKRQCSKIEISKGGITISRHIYKRVYIIGVDGAGSFFTLADTPNIDRIFKNGAVKHDELTAIPTISAQCWGSLLHGVSPQAHRLMNGLVGEKTLDKNYPYHSVFRLVREAFPDAVLASICNWNCINTGIIEQGLGVTEATGNDDEVCEKVCSLIAEKDPKLLFVQLDSVDEAGHRFGYGTPGHLKQITAADSLIGRIYETAQNCGTLDNTLLIVTADHGGTPDGNHGGSTEAEKTVSFFALGESVNPGDFGEAEIRDIASITAFAFGLKQPANWSGRIPDGLFKDGISFERVSEAAADGTKRYSGRKSVPAPTEKGKTLADFVDTKSLICYFDFDGKLPEKAKVNGKLYYTEGFYGSAATLDDCTVTLERAPLGRDDFTFCAFIKLNSKAEKRLCLFTTEEEGAEPGLSFFAERESLVCEINAGSGRIRYERPLPPNFEGSWFHFICSYDRSENELCYYYDFAIDTDWYSEIPVPPELELNGGTVKMGPAPVTLDEVMMFDHKLSDLEIDGLMKYFEGDDYGTYQ